MSDPLAVVTATLEREAGLGRLLDDVAAFIRRYVVLSADQLTAATLWVAHAWAIDAFECTPYLDISSPTPECGKSRLLESLEPVLPRVLRTANVSDAALFRTIADDEDGRPVILFDEADAVFTAKSERPDLRALLNAGYRRGAVVARVEMNGKAAVVRRYDAFGAKALAGIGERPDTIASRSIPIRMRRRASGEPLERFRERVVGVQAAPLRERLAAWASPEVLEALREARPEVPEELSDRQQDAWEGLLAVAEAVGGGWPGRARSAAVALHGERAGEPNPILLLEHVRDALEGRERIGTAELLEALVDRQDGPWAAWWGDGIEAGRTKGPASKLARMLRPFGVEPRKLWTGDRALQGYQAADFEDPFRRYLPPSDPPSDPQNGRSEEPRSEAISALDSQEPDTPSDLHSSDLPSSKSEGGSEDPPTDEEALALLRSELGGATNPVEVIRRHREAGEPDEVVAAYLSTGGWPPPPGMVGWTGYGVRSVLGEGGGLA